jgi:hypothetical protein
MTCLADASWIGPKPQTKEEERWLRKNVKNWLHSDSHKCQQMGQLEQWIGGDDPRNGNSLGSSSSRTAGEIKTMFAVSSVHPYTQVYRRSDVIGALNFVCRNQAWLSEERTAAVRGIEDRTSNTPRSLGMSSITDMDMDIQADTAMRAVHSENHDNQDHKHSQGICRDDGINGQHSDDFGDSDDHYKDNTVDGGSDGHGDEAQAVQTAAIPAPTV